MGRKGGSRHLKRMPAPDFWPISTKGFQWTVRPRPGPHPGDMCIPLSIVLRDHLHLARTAREVRLILSQGKVKVDGRLRRDDRYPIGLMDVLEIPSSKVAFRVIPVKGKGLSLIKTAEDTKAFKICKIDDKKTVAHGQLQIGLHDGRNVLVKVQNPTTPTEDIYSTGASLQIELPSQKILSQIEMAEGAYAVVTAGENIGRHGNITHIETGTATRPGIVEIKDDKGEAFRTITDYVLVVGKEAPVIELSGA